MTKDSKKKLSFLLRALPFLLKVVLKNSLNQTWKKILNGERCILKKCYCCKPFLSLKLKRVTKHDAPPSQFLQNPYWEHFRKIRRLCREISSSFWDPDENGEEISYILYLSKGIHR